MSSAAADPWTQFDYNGSPTSPALTRPPSSAHDADNPPQGRSGLCPIPGASLAPPAKRPQSRAKEQSNTKAVPLDARLTGQMLLVCGVSLVLHSLFPTLFLIGCGLIISGLAVRLLPLAQDGFYARLSPETQQLLELPLLDATRQVFANMTLSKTLTALFLILPLPPDEVDAALARLAPAIRDRLTRRTRDYLPKALFRPPSHKSNANTNANVIPNANANTVSDTNTQTMQIAHVPRVAPAFVDPDGPSLSLHLARRRVARLVSGLPSGPSTRALNVALALVLAVGAAHVRASPLARRWALLVGHALAFIGALLVGHALAFIGAWLAIATLAVLRVRAALRLR